jgi:alkylhydroperoxidase family enzyme
VLRSKFYSAEQVEAIVRDFRNAGLDPADVAMMAFAHKITLHAHRVTPEDIAELRSLGFIDEDILDIVLAAAARNFYSKALDALGAEPDEAYRELEPSLRKALSVGRSFGE